MANIENNTGPVRTDKKQLIRKSTRVDLTPMVDLGFLLITFFVFTNQISQPTAMNLNMPYDKVMPDDPVPECCVLTVFPDSGNTIKYYEGLPGSNLIVKQTSFGPKGIRNIILEKRKRVRELKGTADNFVLIIKPSDRSNFQNFVDIVDEVAISNIKHYYIDEVTAADKILLAQK